MHYDSLSDIEKLMEKFGKYMMGVEVSCLIAYQDKGSISKLAKEISSFKNKNKPYLLLGFDPHTYLWVEEIYKEIVDLIAEGYKVVYSNIKDIYDFSKLVHIFSILVMPTYKNPALKRAYGKDINSSSYYEATFCDLKGTLLILDKEETKKRGKEVYVINEDILSILYEEAKHGPVNLWTGGDIKKWAKIIAEVENSHLLRFPLLSKYLFAGCKVKKVIDDMPKEIFEDTYWIKAETFLHVPYVY